MIRKSPLISVTPSGKIMGGTIYLCSQKIDCSGLISASMLVYRYHSYSY